MSAPEKSYFNYLEQIPLSSILGYGGQVRKLYGVSDIRDEDSSSEEDESDFEGELDEIFQDEFNHDGLYINQLLDSDRETIGESDESMIEDPEINSELDSSATVLQSEPNSEIETNIEASSSEETPYENQPQPSTSSAKLVPNASTSSLSSRRSSSSSVEVLFPSEETNFYELMRRHHEEAMKNQIVARWHKWKAKLKARFKTTPSRRKPEESS